MTLPVARSEKPSRKAIDSEEALADRPRLPCMTSLLDFKLRRAQLLVHQDFAGALAKLKLRPAEFSVLAMIAKYPGQKQTTIADKLGIKRANFVFLMDGIEARGLAVRHKDKSDRRSHSLYLTEEGVNFVERMVALWQDHENRIVATLGGPENRDQLLHLLDRLLSFGNEEGDSDAAGS